MTYKVLKGVVTPSDPVPEALSDYEPPVDSRTGRTCTHGFRDEYNCKHCHAPASHSVVDNRAAGHLLTFQDANDGRQQRTDQAWAEVIERRLKASTNPDPTIYEDIYSWSLVTVGCKVARRIRLEQTGRITSIEYTFTDSKHIRNIFVKWNDRVHATPYTPDELLRMRIQ